MPTYDYHCDNCKKDMEIFHSMNDKPRKKCPYCGKNTLRKIIGEGAGIIFHGSGYYQTDYKNKK